jgi:hypothetical protein
MSHFFVLQQFDDLVFIDAAARKIHLTKSSPTSWTTAQLHGLGFDDFWTKL